MTALKVFILIGVVDSFDNQFATVELDTNPPSNGGHALAIIPVSAFPCAITEGKRFYVVKLSEDEDAVIVCQNDPGIGC
jgi:hypothetical protein